MSIDISILVPCYNESESVQVFFDKVVPIVISTDKTFEFICVNDGSQDDTVAKLLQIKQYVPQIKIVNLSRNFGKDAALTAALDISQGRCVIPIDCDLQDPPELICQMVQKWEEGYDVVLGKRVDRENDTFWKRITAMGFYRICNWLSDIKIPNNVGDFRLMDRKVVDEIKHLRERVRFMKGLFAFAGFKTAYVEYKRPERVRGESKWNYVKLWNYAIDGITSLSTFPLRMSTYIGFFVAFFAFIWGAIILSKVLIKGIDVPGYPSLMVAIAFFGGVQLMSLGIIGEYIGRIYIETKQRPIYIIQEIL